MSLHPNAIQACPSRARRKSHLARGEICLRCEPYFEWSAPCPVCLDEVTAVGTRIQRHGLEVDQTSVIPCPGAGAVVHPLVRVTVGRVYRRPSRQRPARSLVLVGGPL